MKRPCAPQRPSIKLCRACIIHASGLRGCQIARFLWRRSREEPFKVSSARGSICFPRRLFNLCALPPSAKQGGDKAESISSKGLRTTLPPVMGSICLSAFGRSPRDTVHTRRTVHANTPGNVFVFFCSLLLVAARHRPANLLHSQPRAGPLERARVARSHSFLAAHSGDASARPAISRRRQLAKLSGPRGSFKMERVSGRARQSRPVVGPPPAARHFELLPLP